MKLPFSRKLTTKLVFFPFLFVLCLFIVLCAGFYYMGPENSFTDFHKMHLRNLLAEKRLALDEWFEQGEKSVEYLPKNDTIHEAIAAYTASLSESGKHRKRAGSPESRRLSGVQSGNPGRATVQIRTQKLLDDMVLASPCRIFALLSTDGKIIASSQKELTGSNWSDRDFFAGAATEMRSPSARIFYSADSGIVFLAPVFDDNESLIGLVYAAPHIDKLAALLRVERGPYKTEKIEMIDKDGNLMLNQKGAPDRRLKYNLPKDGKENTVRFKDNLFFSVVNLENAPFRLIATVESSEVMLPLTLALALCALFAGVLFIMLLVQSIYSGPKLISRPAARLMHAMNTVASGTLSNINLGKEYEGEFLELKKAFESMMDDLQAKESALGERLKSAETMVPSAPFASISHELKTPLSVLAGAAEGILHDEQQVAGQSRKALCDILSTSKSLMLLINNLNDYALLAQEKLIRNAEPFNLCELLSEIESYAKDFAAMKEIEVIIDCDEAFQHGMVHTEKALLKKLLLNLAGNAVKNTGEGTVTLLASRSIKDGVEYIEISAGDTGEGLRSDEGEDLGFVMAKKMSAMLGGTVEVENLAGKGSVFTVSIPAKSR